jgi:ribose transport system permease protein
MLTFEHADPRDLAAVDDRSRSLRSPLRLRLYAWVADWGVSLFFVGMVLYFSVTTHNFLTVDNFLNIGNFAAGPGIIAAGFTLCLIAGEVDLSMGPAVAAAGMVMAVLLVHGHGLAVALVGLVATGIVIGFVNSILVVGLGVSSFIATLAVYFVLQGFGPYLGGQTFLPPSAHVLTHVAQLHVGKVPLSLLVLLSVYAAGYVFLNFTVAGSYVYATGGNREAARRAGIRVDRLTVGLYVLNGLLAALVACVIVGRTGFISPDPIIGTSSGLMLASLAAVLIGGMDLSGGAGRIERTLLGAILVGVLQNGLTLAGASEYAQIAATGVVFIAAVTLSALGRTATRR